MATLLNRQRMTRDTYRNLYRGWCKDCMKAWVNDVCACSFCGRRQSTAHEFKEKLPQGEKLIRLLCLSCEKHIVNTRMVCPLCCSERVIRRIVKKSLIGKDTHKHNKEILDR